MSGVILDGIQWERCNGCAEWVKIEDLQYEKPTEQFRHGRDLCAACAAKSKSEVETHPMTVKISWLR